MPSSLTNGQQVFGQPLVLQPHGVLVLAGHVARVGPHDAVRRPRAVAFAVGAVLAADGTRPEGFETYFDYMQSKVGRMGDEFMLSEEQCNEVDREFAN